MDDLGRGQQGTSYVARLRSRLHAAEVQLGVQFERGARAADALLLTQEQLGAADARVCELETINRRLSKELDRVKTEERQRLNHAFELRARALDVKMREMKETLTRERDEIAAKASAQSQAQAQEIERITTAEAAASTALRELVKNLKSQIVEIPETMQALANRTERHALTQVELLGKRMEMAEVRMRQLRQDAELRAKRHAELDAEHEAKQRLTVAEERERERLMQQLRTEALSATSTLARVEAERQTALDQCARLEKRAVDAENKAEKAERELEAARSKVYKSDEEHQVKLNAVRSEQAKLRVLLDEAKDKAEVIERRAKEERKRAVADVIRDSTLRETALVASHAHAQASWMEEKTRLEDELRGIKKRLISDSAERAAMDVKLQRDVAVRLVMCLWRFLHEKLPDFFIDKPNGGIISSGNGRGSGIGGNSVFLDPDTDVLIAACMRPHAPVLVLLGDATNSSTTSTKQAPSTDSVFSASTSSTTDEVTSPTPSSSSTSSSASADQSPSSSRSSPSSSESAQFVPAPAWLVRGLARWGRAKHRHDGDVADLQARLRLQQARLDLADVSSFTTPKPLRTATMTASSSSSASGKVTATGTPSAAVTSPSTIRAAVGGAIGASPSRSSSSAALSAYSPSSPPFSSTISSSSTPSTPSTPAASSSSSSSSSSASPDESVSLDYVAEYEQRLQAFLAKTTYAKTASPPKIAGTSNAKESAGASKTGAPDEKGDGGNVGTSEEFSGKDAPPMNDDDDDTAVSRVDDINADSNADDAVLAHILDSDAEEAEKHLLNSILEGKGGGNRRRRMTEGAGPDNSSSFTSSSSSSSSKSSSLSKPASSSTKIGEDVKIRVSVPGPHTVTTTYR